MFQESAFETNFSDPLCKLNLKENSEFVRAFAMSSSSSNSNKSALAEGKKSSVGKWRVEAPSTPGRPIFNFSIGNHSRKSVPSKWEDAEKWLISTSCHESPAHVAKSSETSKFLRQNSKASVPSEVLLKDKFTDNVESIFPNFKYSEPSKEGFLFCEPVKDAATATEVAAPEVNHRDIGTEMTPIGSSTTTRCHTPIKSSSPAGHNTPANRSGPLVGYANFIDISELNDFHFAKLDLGAQFDSVASKWSSREEEDEEIWKSLRHFEMEGGRKSNKESRASEWENEERTKSCIRYQREEARIQAWVNLQKAKAEAQSRKLEVKIQKIRSDLEEKLIKRMAIVNRKAEEWRASAQLQHSQQMLKASEQAKRMKSLRRSQFNDNRSCGCLPCNSHL